MEDQTTLDPGVFAELAAHPERLYEIPEENLPEIVGVLERLRADVWCLLLQLNQPEQSISQELETDRMLTVDEAAEILGVESRWLYDRSDSLPFARKLAPRTLRFSKRGLYRWLETRP